jgi:hypothetical protein
MGKAVQLSILFKSIIQVNYLYGPSLGFRVFTEDLIRLSGEMRCTFHVTDQSRGSRDFNIPRDRVSSFRSSQ